MNIEGWTAATPAETADMVDAALRVARERATVSGEADWQPSDECWPIVVVVPEEGDLDETPIAGVREKLDLIQRMGRDTRI